MNDNEPKLSIVRTTPTIELRAGRDVEIPARRDIVDEVELAARLGVSRSTLQSWRYSGRGPRYIKIGRLVRYRNADVEAFLAACTRDQCA